MTFASKVTPEVEHFGVFRGRHERDCKHVQTREKQRSHSDPSLLPLRISNLLGSPGQPLELPTRAFLEPRFGYSFAHVRVHTGEEATGLARAFSARAFTFNNHVFFDAGQYQPRSSTGRHLLAHEIAHVVQQRGQHPGPETQLRVSSPGDLAESQAEVAADRVMIGLTAGPQPRGPVGLQRKCHEEGLGKPSHPCISSDRGVIGWQLLFDVGCDDLLPGEEAKLAKLKGGAKYNVHGFASREGKTEFNEDLSCHRAHRAAQLLEKLRPDCQVAGRFKHGASPPVAPGLVPDPHPLAFWRNVIFEEVRSGGSKDLNEWVNPSVAVITEGWPLYNQAKKEPTASKLDAVASHRPKLKTWLEGIAMSVSPEGSKLTRTDISNYRKYYDSAEELWRSMDQLLAQQNHAAAKKDTYAVWAAGEGEDQGSRSHAQNVPTGAKYHIDIFGEGYYKGAINVGMAARTSTTGVYGSRVPYPIYRRFSSKDAAHIPIADHVADLVTSENGPLRNPGIAEEIARIIAPGGTIVLYNPISEEEYHDKVFALTRGTISKEHRGPDNNRIVETRILVPGP